MSDKKAVTKENKDKDISSIPLNIDIISEEDIKKIEEDLRGIKKKKDKKQTIDLTIVSDEEIKALEQKLRGKSTTKKKTTNLEGTVTTGTHHIGESGVGSDLKYIDELRHEPVKDIYAQLKHIHEEVRETGTLTQAQTATLYAITDALEEKKRDIVTGSYTATQEAREEANLSEKFVRSILGTYKGPNP